MNQAELDKKLRNLHTEAQMLADDIQEFIAELHKPEQQQRPNATWPSQSKFTTPAPPSSQIPIELQQERLWHNGNRIIGWDGNQPKFQTDSNGKAIPDPNTQFIWQRDMLTLPKSVVDWVEQNKNKNIEGWKYRMASGKIQRTRS